LNIVEHFGFVSHAQFHYGGVVESVLPVARFAIAES
jgi:hypothetical protein